MKLSVIDVSLSLGGRPIVKDISLNLGKGELVGLVGPNGAGKSTLLKAIGGFLPLTQGSITFDGQSIQGLSNQDLAKCLAYMEQDPPIPVGYSVEELVLLARTPYLKWYQKEGTEDREIVKRVLEKLDLWNLRGRLVESLSGGQRQLVFLAKALAQETPLLCLDEPVSALDLVNGEGLFNKVRTFTQKGGSALVVVHDLELAAKYCNRLVLLKEGQVLADGGPKEVLTGDNLLKAYGMKADVYDDGRHGNRRLYILNEEV